MVEWLLESKADVNAAAHDGTMALLNSAACGHEEVTSVLVGAKANVSRAHHSGIRTHRNYFSCTGNFMFLSNI